MEAATDAAVSRFREQWRHERRQKAGRRDQRSHREKRAAIPVEEASRAAEGDSKCFWLRGWGIHAGAGDLRTALQRPWAAREPGAIANLLKAFPARALPEFDARLIERCRHGAEAVRRRALAALARNAHPLVREFALTELRKGVRQNPVVALFINNYRQGDGHRIPEALELPDGDGELHGLLMDALKGLGKNPEADRSRPGVISHASTPRENCRCAAARLLRDQQVAPGWLVDECRYDSGGACRALADNSTGSRGAS